MSRPCCVELIFTVGLIISAQLVQSLIFGNYDNFSETFCVKLSCCDSLECFNERFSHVYCFDRNIFGSKKSVKNYLLIILEFVEFLENACLNHSNLTEETDVLFNQFQTRERFSLEDNKFTALMVPRKDINSSIPFKIGVTVVNFTVVNITCERPKNACKIVAYEVEYRRIISEDSQLILEYVSHTEYIRRCYYLNAGLKDGRYKVRLRALFTDGFTDWSNYVEIGVGDWEPLTLTYVIKIIFLFVFGMALCSCCAILLTTAYFALLVNEFFVDYFNNVVNRVVEYVLRANLYNRLGLRFIVGILIITFEYFGVTVRKLWVQAKELYYRIRRLFYVIRRVFFRITRLNIF